MKKHYSFTSQWQFRAPLTKVWDAIYESEKWPEWWSSVKEVTEIEKGNEEGIGSVRVYTLSSPTKYKLKFKLLVTERQDHKLLKGLANGDLEGTGIWRFSEKDGISTAECEWQVATTISWMNYFSFFLAPLFRFNHSLVMQQGAKSLAKKMNADLLSY